MNIRLAKTMFYGSDLMDYNFNFSFIKNTHRVVELHAREMATFKIFKYLNCAAFSELTIQIRLKFH